METKLIRYFLFTDFYNTEQASQNTERLFSPSPYPDNFNFPSNSTFSFINREIKIENENRVSLENKLRILNYCSSKLVD